MSEETLQEVEFVGPGAILRNAREEQGLSVQSVAEKLHLRLTIVKSLEADEYSTDISPTFTKGYLKLYSRLLGLDEAKVLTAYQQMGALEKEPAKLQSFSQKVARQASDQRLMLFTYFVLAIVLAMVVVWWLQQDDSSFTSKLEKAIQAPIKEQPAPIQNTDANTSSDVGNAPTGDSNTNEVVISSANDEAPIQETSQGTGYGDGGTQGAGVDAQTGESVQDSSQEEISQEKSDQEGNAQEGNNQEETAQTLGNTLSGNSTSVETGDIDTTLDSSTESANDVITDFADDAADLVSSEEEAENPDLSFNDAPTVTDSSVFLTDPVELVFEFSGDCWMKLTDATGEDVAYGVKAAGRTMPISGIPPFEVVLGAPESVQISYAGQPIDMTQFRPGYTARFKLPLTD